MRQPTSPISPRVDGTRTSFFEWRGAGFYRVPSGGSMFQEYSLISGLYWGFDAGRLFLRVDPVEARHQESTFIHPDLKIWFKLTAPNHSITAQLSLHPPALSLSARTNNQNDQQVQELGNVKQVAFKEVVEMAIPLARLGFSPGARIGLTLQINRQSRSIATIPSQGVIEIELPGIP